ncbi:Uncharacterised protein [Mobiluncus mulieris]|uniref:hypothetical protein n=1 Tax=Mobiluncus mulieris TaxID=2052 RepID=UPI000D98CFC7|nr:hypothetical protein [Mobiluncus mulieris]SPX76159.1 Uncharacterised protein [Mobiluncus mulieris]
MKRKFIAMIGTCALTLVSLTAIPAHGATTNFWGFAGPGFTVNVTDNNSTVALSGTSRGGQWTGSRATTAHQMPPTGTTNVVLRGNMGKNCEQGDCPFGSGSGYQGVVEFRFDSQNYYQIGILNQGNVTWGPEIVVLGTHLGNPFRVTQPLVTDAQKAANANIIQKMQSNQKVDLDEQHYIKDFCHLIKAQWTRNYIRFVVDNTRVFGGYNFTAGDKNGPSITFMAAAQNPNDAVNVVFDNLNISGKVPGSTVFIPQGKPYAMITANMKDNGYGVGHSSYIKLHDDHGTAVSAGIQTAQTAPETGGNPYYISGRMSAGIFDYDYVQPADFNWHNLRIEWWKENGWAVIWADGKPIANMKAKLSGRIYASVEGNAAQNGDYVHAYFSGVEAQIGHGGGDCGFHHEWGLQGTYGLQARKTGANSFEVEGQAQGIPAGKDWDTTLVGGVAMIWQYLPENRQSGQCMTSSWSQDPAHR